MKRNNKSLILSLLATVLGITGLIFLTATAVVSNYVDSDNWYRVFFNGVVKWRLIGITSIYSMSGFPIAVTVLSLIGIIATILGSLYWFGLALTGKKKCSFTDFKLPGPMVGIIVGLGGIIGFVGSMVFIPFGNDIISGAQHYAIGYIIPTTIFGLFILIGILILATTKKGKKTSKKKKR
ncbi:MAG: hypothetical protein FK733_04680 [Asgard group archaeon]|nr:hypothetical protein [Asgard group archaeon]